MGTVTKSPILLPPLPDGNAYQGSSEVNGDLLFCPSCSNLVTICAFFGCTTYFFAKNTGRRQFCCIGLGIILKNTFASLLQEMTASGSLLSTSSDLESKTSADQGGAQTTGKVTTETPDQALFVVTQDKRATPKTQVGSQRTEGKGEAEGTTNTKSPKSTSAVNAVQVNTISASTIQHHTATRGQKAIHSHSSHSGSQVPTQSSSAEVLFVSTLKSKLSSETSLARAGSGSPLSEAAEATKSRKPRTVIQVRENLRVMGMLFLRYQIFC